MREAQRGIGIADVCRQLGMSESTFYLWRKKFAYLSVSHGSRFATDGAVINGPSPRPLAEATLDG